MLILLQPAHASSPAAWATHRQEVEAACSRASGLIGARLVGRPIEYDDSVGTTVALISGTHPQAHMTGRAGRSLCLYDRRSRTVKVTPADGWP